MSNESLLYWLWLSSAVSLRQRSRAALLEHFGSPDEIYEAKASAYTDVQGVYRADAELLKSKSLDDAKKILELCDNRGTDIVCYDDEQYPERLRQIYSPPAVLYVKGKLPAVDELPVVSVIGTRKASPYGIKMGRSIAFEIGSFGGTVVSLLTEGVDAAAAEGVLLSGGKCIAVLGTSHDSHRSSFDVDITSNGAIISEYPPETHTVRSFFRERNRIASGLSLGVVVVEAPEKSGTKYFVDEALEQGKDVFAVPGNADSKNSEGTLNLLKLGAKPVASGWDVLSEYEDSYPEIIVRKEVSIPFGEIPKEKPAPPVKENIDKEENGGYIDWTEKLKGLSEDQRAIALAVRDGAASTDEIIIATGLGAARVLSQMTILEIKGIIAKDAARHIVIK